MLDFGSFNDFRICPPKLSIFTVEVTLLALPLESENAGLPEEFQRPSLSPTRHFPQPKVHQPHMKHFR